MSGEQVPPETGAMDTSTVSAPASKADMMHKTDVPAVSWVWNEIGLSVSLRMRLMVSCTIAGVQVPDASFKHRESNGTSASRTARKRCS